MALESGVTYIEDLVATNPNEPDNDTLDEADNHLRIIKTAVQGSFPSLGAVAVTKTAAEINDLATITGSETLTNKTLTSAAFSGTQTGFSGNVTGNVTGNCTGSSGSTTGNAATVTTNANLTGDVTSVGNATTLAPNSVTSSPLSTASTGDTRLIGASSSVLIPDGYYLMSNTTGITMELKDALSVWRPFAASGIGGMMFSNGSHMRWTNTTGGNITVTFRKLD